MEILKLVLSVFSDSSNTGATTGGGGRRGKEGRERGKG